MLRVMLDTNYWISLKYSPETRKRFTELASSDEIEVCLCYGNFIDLVQANEQDELSEILAQTVDIYIPSMRYEGDEVIYTESPLGLIPDRDFREFASEQTEGLTEADTLKYIFWDGDWNVDESWYAEYTQTLKETHDEYGFDAAQAVVFYGNDGLSDHGMIDGKYEIDFEDIGPLEWVRKLVSLYRVAQFKEKERVKVSDIVDMEICSQSILTNCDMLLIESKWRNNRLVEKVFSHLEGERDMEVFDDFDEFLRTLEVYLADV